MLYNIFMKENLERGMDMKVDMNQMSDEEQVKKRKKSSESKKNLKDTPVGEGIYRSALKTYLEDIKNGKLLRQNKFWIVVCVILFVVFISTNSKVSNQKTHLIMELNKITKETADLENATKELKADLEEQARIESAKLTQEEEQLARNNAIEQGVLVAKLQNEYYDIELPKTPSEDADEEQQAAYRQAMNVYSENVKDNAAALDAYFGPNDKNARAPWYNYREPVGISGTWEFVSKASFKGNIMQVLWLCYSNDQHVLLSYCTAVYNADSKLFSDVTCMMTQYAQSHLSTDDAEPMTDSEQIMSITDKLKELANSSDFQPSDLNEEIQGELSETRDSYKQAVANGEVEDEEYDPNYNIGLPQSNDLNGVEMNQTEGDQ